MLPTSLAAPAVLFIATVGAISVFKAVYIDKRELRCACIGGNSDALFGFVSLTEKLMMTGMAIVILVKSVFDSPLPVRNLITFKPITFLYRTG